jgi:hypothetical protein
MQVKEADKGIKKKAQLNQLKKRMYFWSIKWASSHLIGRSAACFASRRERNYARAARKRQKATWTEGLKFSASFLHGGRRRRFGHRLKLCFPVPSCFLLCASTRPSRNFLSMFECLMTAGGSLASQNLAVVDRLAGSHFIER